MTRGTKNMPGPRRASRRRAPLPLAAAALLLAAAAVSAAAPLPAAALGADGGAGLALASALLGGGGGRAAADAVWAALKSGGDGYDAGARSVLGALLGMDAGVAAHEGDGGGVSAPAPPRRVGDGARALRGFAVEDGMAPLSRYSATMQGE